MDARFQIDFGNGYVDVQPPINHAAIALDIIFTKDKARAQLQSINFEWVANTAEKINAYKEAGLAGGKGIAYGLPLKIISCDDANEFFDVMLNLGHAAARFECDRVVAPIREAGGNDWFEKETQAFYFWNLTNLGVGVPGRITKLDYKKTPYSITTIPDGEQVAMLSVTAALIAIQIEQSITQFVTYTSLAVAAAVSVPPHAGLIAAYTILAAAQLLIIITLINLFIRLLKQILDNIIQQKKWKYCMREADLFLKLTAYIGVSFSSSIYGYSQSLPVTDGYAGKFVNATWMPAKIVMPASGSPLNFNFVFERAGDETQSPKSFGYFEGTADEFCKKMETKYNAEGKLINGVYYFEEKHFWNNTNPYIIPNTADVGYTFNQPHPHGTNLSELAPTTHLAFQVDESELNTLHRYRGTTADVTIKNNSFPVNKYSGWGQGKIVDLGSALGKRKIYLNKVEQTLDALFGDFFDFLDEVSALPGIGAADPLDAFDVSKRIGWLELSNDSFSEPKTFIGTPVNASTGEDWEIDVNSEADMSAISLLENFHGKELATRGNQWKTFFDKKSKFCCSDFAQIKNSNVLQTPDSPPKSGKFTAMVWRLADDIAENTDYRINEMYLSGLSEEIKIDGTTTP